MPDVGDAVTLSVISETIPFPERGGECHCQVSDGTGWCC